MKMHPADSLLRRLLRSVRASTDSLQQHLSGCARCRRRLEGMRVRQQAGGQSYDAALTAGARHLSRLQAVYGRERAEAHGLISELLKHPPERQLILVRHHPRFQTWGVFERLLDMSREESSRNPGRAEDLARMALHLSDQLNRDVYGVEAIEDLRARGWSYIGNALRVKSEFQAAHEAFERALVHLRQGTRDLWEKAIWLDLKASLLRSQRRLEESMQLLAQAYALFMAVGDRHRAGRVLLNMDYVHHHAGEPERGIPLLYQALEHIDPEQEPQLVLIAKHNLIDDLAETGRYMEAQRLLIQARPLYERFNEPWIRNRSRWVEGKIAGGMGQLERCEALLLAASTGFRELEAGYEVALVSLDLAILYASQGRTTEMKQLAEEMVPIFSSRHIHREGLAALALWQKAVDSESATAELTSRISSVIKYGRQEPAHGG